MMKRYQHLRRARIVVSVVIWMAVTLMWIGYGGMMPGIRHLLERVMIVPFGLAFSGLTLVFWIVVTALFGRIYCSSVCPLGTCLDMVGHVGLRRRSHTPSAGYRYSRPLTRWRFISLGIVVVSALAGIAMIPVMLDPYSIYSSAVVNLLRPVWATVCNAYVWLGSVTGLWSASHADVVVVSAFYLCLTVVTVLAASIPAWFYGRTWCNSMCPVGTVLGIVSKQALWHIDIDTDLCINCGRCSDACKASCIDLVDHVVDGSRCVNCFDCLPVCPNDAIFYRTTRKQLSIPMLQSTQPQVGASATCAAPGCCDSVATSRDAGSDSVDSITKH